jgi:hypothetical protein
VQKNEIANRTYLHMLLMVEEGKQEKLEVLHELIKSRSRAGEATTKRGSAAAAKTPTTFRIIFFGAALHRASRHRNHCPIPPFTVRRNPRALQSLPHISILGTFHLTLLARTHSQNG